MRLKTPAEQHEFNLRRFNCYDMAPLDAIYAAAEFIKGQASQLAAADARNKILEAEQAAMRADRDRLADKVKALREYIEERWDQDANRTNIAAILYDAQQGAA